MATSSAAGTVRRVRNRTGLSTLTSVAISRHAKPQASHAPGRSAAGSRRATATAPAMSTSGSAISSGERASPTPVISCDRYEVVALHPSAGDRRLLASAVAVSGHRGRPSAANTRTSASGMAQRPPARAPVRRGMARRAGHAAYTTTGSMSRALSRADHAAPISTPAPASHHPACRPRRARSAAHTASATKAGMTASGRSRVAHSTSSGATATSAAATSAGRRPASSRPTRNAAVMASSEQTKGQATAR